MSIARNDGPAQAAPMRNILASMAEDARAAYEAGKRKTIEAARAYLDCGATLAAARAECKRGEWQAVLDRAGIPSSTARLLVRISKAGMDAETLARVGVRGARAMLAETAPAREGETETAPDTAAPGTPAPPAAPIEKPLTVSDNAAPPAPGTAPEDGPASGPGMATATAYRARRQAGRCTDCGAPAPGRSRCADCAARIAIRRRRRRGLASIGEAVFETGAGPRIVKAAAAGRGAALSKAETARLAAVLAKGPAGPGAPAREGETETAAGAVFETGDGDGDVLAKRHPRGRGREGKGR